MHYSMYSIVVYKYSLVVSNEKAWGKQYPNNSECTKYPRYLFLNTNFDEEEQMDDYTAGAGCVQDKPNPSCCVRKQVSSQRMKETCKGNRSSLNRIPPDKLGAIWTSK